MATSVDLNILQGATFSARIAVTDSTGAAINLSGYTTRGWGKHRYSDTNKLLAKGTGTFVKSHIALSSLDTYRVST